MGPAAADMSDAGGSRKRKASMDTAAGDREPLQQLQQQEFLAAAAKATTSDPAAAPLNAFELQRQQRIEHNRQRMQELGVGQAAAAVKQSMQSNGNKRRRTASKKKKVGGWFLFVKFNAVCGKQIIGRCYLSPSNQPANTRSLAVVQSKHTLARLSAACSKTKHCLAPHSACRKQQQQEGRTVQQQQQSPAGVPVGWQHSL